MPLDAIICLSNPFFITYPIQFFRKASKLQKSCCSYFILSSIVFLLGLVDGMIRRAGSDQEKINSDP